MAKKASVMQRRNHFARHDQETRRRCRQGDNEPSRPVNQAEPVHPGCKSTSYQEKEDDVALKKPLGYLKVGSHEEPIFAPIPGFEHVFDADAEHAAKSSAYSLFKQHGFQPQYPGVANSPSTFSKPSKGVKRSRENDHEDKENDADEEEESEAISADVTLSFHVGDIAALKAFYAVRFRELTMKPMRDIVTAWVKRLEPRRQQKYGPYQRYPERRGKKLKSFIKPPWWPASVPYVEPSHLKLQDLVPLAVVIMLVHRTIDDIKRQQDPWIQKLKDDAIYLVTSKTTEHFSSSKGTEYNEAMKKRALEIILPSLFDVAQSHEDYVFQEAAYEGAGNLGPDFGKPVFWQHAPRPDRSQRWKRPCIEVKTEPNSEDEVGDETELDEEPAEEPTKESGQESDQESDEEPNDQASRTEPSSSFHSEMSYTEDAKIPLQHARRESSAMDVVHNIVQDPHQNVTLATGDTPVDQPMNGLRLENNNALVTSPAYPIPPTIASGPNTVGWQYYNQLAPGWFVNRDGQVFGFTPTSTVDPNTTFVECAPINGLPLPGAPTPNMFYQHSPSLQTSCSYPIPGNMVMQDIPMTPGCSPFQ